MLLLRRVLRRVFACGEEVYLSSCLKCSFLFFLPPASSFSFPTLCLRGSPASRIFLHPPASSFSSSPTSQTLALSKRSIQLQLQRQTPLQPKFSDPTCIGGLKNRLRFFLGALKTLAWGHFCRHEFAISHSALKNMISKKNTPFFDPLPIGLAKTPLQIYSW